MISISRVARLLRWSALWAALLFVGSSAQAQTSVTIDGAATGLTFQGIGGVSAGGVSRLLIDYPEPFRSQILDYLFKPYYGASLQDLKVEIGGDVNAGSGAEPTHMLSSTDQNYTRGYEWWMMQQAKLRNPSIPLGALEWGAPGWIGGGEFFSQDNINYILNFINGAQTNYGLTINYVGIWNEDIYNAAWIEDLKTSLQSDGLSTLVVAADECCGSQWNIAGDMVSDSKLSAAVDVIGVHYPGGTSSLNAVATGKPIWDSESGPWRNDWVGAQSMAATMLEDYPASDITKTDFWGLITSYYDIASISNAGLMQANTPWSGNYTVSPAIWAIAHVTQFAQPGWSYVNGACGNLWGGGTYITLKSPNGADYSTILETSESIQTQTVSFSVKNGLSTGVVHVWMSNASAQFVQQSDVTPVDGSFSITLAPGSIYSLTTTTGQNKGGVAPPPSSAFPFPYVESFDEYPVGSTPLYFEDYSGMFETANCGGSRSGLCLRQLVTTPPIPWVFAATPQPTTVVGDVNWTNYQESVDTLFEQPNSTATLYGRTTGIRQSDKYVYGYLFTLDTSGNWNLQVSSQTLLLGTVAAPALNSWHNLKMIFNGSVIQAFIDGTVVATIYDTTYAGGLAGVGTSYSNTQFDNFSIESLPGVDSVSVEPPVTSLAGGQQRQFTASVSGTNNQVTWSINPNVGTISASGLYNAPAFVAASQTVRITATGVADTTQSGTATLTLEPVSVSLTPSATALFSGQTQQFNAAVVNTSNTGVSWSLSPVLGTISPAGLYTPPALVTVTQSITVAVTSAADPTKTASATVTLNPTPPPAIVQQPQTATISSGQTATFTVTASGFGVSYQWESAPSGSSSFAMISGATASSYTTPVATLSQNGTQYVCVVTNLSGSISSDVATLNVLPVVPGINYITSFNPGSPRNNFTGWIGMSVTVGSSPVTVTALGQLYLPGNTGTHAMKIVNASTSQDVAGSTVSVSMSTGSAGAFASALLPAPITLNANTSYYIVAQEASGGDTWYDVNSTVATTSVATETGAVFSYDGANYATVGSPQQSYGPVGFLYTIAATQPVVTAQPQSQTVSAGATASFAVTATGGALTYQWESAPSGSSTFTNISGATSSSYTTPITSISQSGTQYVCVVTNTAGSVSTNVITLTVVSGVPATNYVTSFNPGAARNNFTGWVGMSITIGSSPVTVTALGQAYLPGNTGTHTLKIVNAANSQDVAGSSVSVSMIGGTTGTFVYATLAAPVTLFANTTYYILGQEMVGGDGWYDYQRTSVQTTSVAAVTSAVYGNGSSYTTVGSNGQTYGPVDFLYGSASSQPSIVQQPVSATVTAGQAATFNLTATGVGLNYQWQSEAPGAGSFTNIGGATSSSYTTPATSVSQTGTQYICVVSNSNGNATSNAVTMTVTQGSATTDFVTSDVLGTLRNNYTGFVGMNITVGASPVTVAGLGRIVAASGGGSHLVKIVQASTGVDVPGGSATVNVGAGTVGTFAYATLSSPVTLSAGASYYIVTEETNGGDVWYDFTNSSVQTTSVAAAASAVYGNGSSYTTVGSNGQTYGPVDFLYGSASSQPSIVQQPVSATVTAGQAATFNLTATGVGLNYQWQSEAPGAGSFTNIGGATSSSYTTPATSVSQTGTQYICVVSNSNGNATSNAVTMTVTQGSATTDFVTSDVLGTLRNNYTGFVGMNITVGASPVTVAGLGRIVAASGGGSHLVKIVQASTGVDVPGGSATVNVGAGTVGTFAYATLSSPVTLSAGASYYIVTEETNGGDVWYDFTNSSVQTTSVAAVTSAVYSNGSSFIIVGSAGRSYGLVDIQY